MTVKARVMPTAIFLVAVQFLDKFSSKKASQDTTVGYETNAVLAVKILNNHDGESEHAITL
jgi:hypothetical protein